MFHHQIQEDDVRNLFLQEPQGLFLALRGENPEAAAGEEDGLTFQEIAIVIYKQDFFSGTHDSRLLPDIDWVLGSSI